MYAFPSLELSIVLENQYSKAITDFLRPKINAKVYTYDDFKNLINNNVPQQNVYSFQQPAKRKQYPVYYDNNNLDDDSEEDDEISDDADFYVRHQNVYNSRQPVKKRPYPRYYHNNNLNRW